MASYAAASCGRWREHGHRHTHHKYGFHPHHHYGRQSKHYDMKFRFIASELANVDHKVLEQCNENTIEQYNVDELRLYLKFDDYDVESVKVKAKYRVVYINALKSDNTEEYNEIRLLPLIADIANASWSLQDGTLIVKFPFRQDQNSCTALSEEDVIVPRREEEEFQIDIRLGDDENEKTKNQEQVRKQSPKDIETNLINEKVQ